MRGKASLSRLQLNDLCADLEFHLISKSKYNGVIKRRSGHLGRTYIYTRTYARCRVTGFEKSDEISKL